METSAKTGFNTQELFVSAAKLLYQSYCLTRANSRSEEKIKLDNELIRANEKKGCCK